MVRMYSTGASQPCTAQSAQNVKIEVQWKQNHYNNASVTVFNMQVGVSDQNQFCPDDICGEMSLP